MGPTLHDEILRLRDGDDQADADAARADVPETIPGADRRAGVIATTRTDLPAGCFYKIDDVAIGGPEVEGGTGTEAKSGARFLAYNLGSKVPPPLAKVTCTFVPYRWVFTYGPPAIATLASTPPPTPTGGGSTA